MELEKLHEFMKTFWKCYWLVKEKKKKSPGAKLKEKKNGTNFIVPYIMIQTETKKGLLQVLVEQHAG